MEIKSRWPEHRPLKELVDNGLDKLGLGSLVDEYNAERLYYVIEHYPSTDGLTFKDNIIIAARTVWDTAARTWARYVTCRIKGHDIVDSSPRNCGESGAFQLNCKRCGWTHSGWM